MKTARKVLCALLAMLILCTTVALSASAKTAADIAVGEDFLFGMYPQTRVRDKDLIETLNASTPDANGYVSIGTNVYKRGYVEEYDNNHYQFMEHYGYHKQVVYWFRCDAIAWRVLAKDADSVLLMSEKVLDTRQFNKTMDNKWETSSVRAWLNGAFMNEAFSDTEKAFVLQTVTENKGNPIVKSSAAADTVDRVYLPSFEDITNNDYGFNTACSRTDPKWIDDFGRFVGYYYQDTARQAERTQYSEFRSVWVDYDDEGLTEDEPILSTAGYGRYWLRTAGTGADGCDVNGVLASGRVSMGWPCYYPMLGIRPMMRVSLDAVQSPIRLYAKDGTIRYREEGVKIEANIEGVIWSSSNPDIASIDETTGEITINDIGTVTITAMLPGDDSSAVSCDLKIEYTWWQEVIRIFLFGWIWY